MPDLSITSLPLSSGACVGIGPHVVNKAMLVSHSALGTEAGGTVEVQLHGHQDGHLGVCFRAKWYVHWEYDGVNLPTISSVDTVVPLSYNATLTGLGFPSVAPQPVIVDFDACPHIAVQFSGVAGLDVDVDTFYQFVQAGGV